MDISNADLLDRRYDLRSMFGRKSVQCISDYLDEVYAIQKKWDLAPGADLWFRGESTRYRKTLLVPRMYRPTKETEELLEAEFRIFQDFTRCGQPLCDVVPTGDWDWYFLMQHHGAPTRLLDWSDGALIALHFAITDFDRSAVDRVVYVLDPDWLGDEIDKLQKSVCAGEGDEETEAYLPRDDYDRRPLPDQPLVLESPHITRRIGAQRSRFIVFGKDRDWLRLLHQKRGKRLVSVLIAGTSVEEIKDELRTCGVTESVIFPDLDGLGREMNSLWNRRNSV